MTRNGAIQRTMLALLGSAAFVTAPSASAQSEPMLGQFMQVGFNFCPRGFANADGQLLAISQNTALFSLLGTFYGGDGRTTFALPDMRGRMAVHLGTGPGLSTRTIGQKGGSEGVTLTAANMATHNHRGGGQTANAAANATTANGNAFGLSSNDSFISGTDPYANLMDRNMVQVQPTGGSLPVPVRPPYLTMRWCIALQGVFPSRN